MQFFQGFLDIPILLGASVFIPIAIFIITFIVGMPPTRGAKSSLTVGFTLVGITYFVDQLGILLTEIATIIINRLGFIGMFSDIGITFAKYVSESTTLTSYTIPVAMIVNVVMLLIRGTRTINLNLWGLWMSTFTGVIVEILTGQFSIGMVAMITTMVLTLVLADMSSEGIEEMTGLRGVSFTELQSVAFVPIGDVMHKGDKYLPKIFTKDITLKCRFKRMGDVYIPCLVGMILIATILLLHGADLIIAFRLAMSGGSIIYIGQILFQMFRESFVPIGEAIAIYTRDKAHLHGSLRIGLSSTVIMSLSSTAIISIAMVPVTLYLAKFLPNNSFLPTSDIATLPYLVAMVMIICRAKVLRTLISCTVAVTVALYCSTYLGGIFTQAVQTANPILYGDIGASSNLYGAGNPVVLIISQLASFGPAGIALLILLILLIVTWNFNRLNGHVKIYVKKASVLLASSLDEMKRKSQNKKDEYQNTVSPKRQKLRDAVSSDKEEEKKKQEELNKQNNKKAKKTVKTEGEEEGEDKEDTTTSTNDTPDKK